MADTPDRESVAGRAGRGLVKLFSGLFGKASVRKVRQSAEALKEEFRAGREEAAAPPEKPLPIPHEELREGASRPDRGGSGSSGAP